MSGIGLTRKRAPKKARGLTVSTASVSEEPIGVPEVQDYVRTETDAVLIHSLISGVREQVEQRIGRLLVRRDVTAQWRKVPEGASLPFPPHETISEVRLLDARGDADVLTSTQWYTRGLDDLKLFPSGGAPYGLEVDYTAGYQDVPNALRMQMLRDIASRYDHRSQTKIGRSVVELPDPSAYDQWRVLR